MRPRAVRKSDIPVFAAGYANPELMTHQNSGALTPKTQAAQEERVRCWCSDAATQLAFSLERRHDEALLGILNLSGFGPARPSGFGPARRSACCSISPFASPTFTAFSSLSTPITLAPGHCSATLSGP